MQKLIMNRFLEERGPAELDRTTTPPGYRHRKKVLHCVLSGHTTPVYPLFYTILEMARYMLIALITNEVRKDDPPFSRKTNS